MHKYVVESNRRVTSGILHLVLKPDENPVVFVPGQYAAISVASRGRSTGYRCFSLASAPAQLDRIEFGIRIGGKFTNHLSTLAPGAHVRVLGAFGYFGVNGLPKGNAVLLAGGIGITPFLSILRQQAIVPEDRKFTLVLSARSQDDIPFLPEILELAERGVMRLVLCVSAGPIDKLARVDVRVGRVSDELLRELGAGTTQSHWLICGPPPYMAGLRRSLKILGVSDDAVITEAFSQANKRQTSRMQAWPLNMYLLGAAGTLSTGVLVAGQDIANTLPATQVPKNLTDEALNPQAKLPAATRSNDLDRLVASLSAKVAGGDSPALVTSTKLAADSAAKAAEVRAQNAAISAGKPYVPAAKTVPTSSAKVSATTANSGSTGAAVPAPTPVPVKVPVCTTSASGVRTCV